MLLSSARVDYYFVFFTACQESGDDRGASTGSVNADGFKHCALADTVLARYQRNAP